MLEEKINQNFLLPIDFNSKTYNTPTNLYEDLELIDSPKDSSNNSLYEHLLKPKLPFSYLSMAKLSKKYTTDIEFLKNTQKMMKNNKKINKNEETKIVKAWESFKNIREDPNFMEKYQYINFDLLKFLNKSVIFLTVISIYSILSPLLNLLAPLLLLIVPFFIIKLKGMKISLSIYWRLLVLSLQKHSFGRLLTDWSSLPWSQKTYMIIMLGMYGTINSDILNIKHYLYETRNKISGYISKIDNLPTYQNYKQYLQDKLENINELYHQLNKIPTASFHPKKMVHIGYTMQQYYLLYESDKIENTMLFSFGFWGFLDNIGEISEKINKNEINKTTFSTKNHTILKMKQAYYPTLQYQSIQNKNIPNDISLKKNKIITGPNASGKTSLLKNIITNLLISQQFGYGFFKKSVITPFEHIHCYLNIPDTSSRDSLFQAEARRCQLILKEIEKYPNDKHFCIFDELFSGTNPYEAVSSACAYLTHISEFENVKFMLTTHFIRLCKLMKKQNNIENINMKTKLVDLKPEYFYKVQKGISQIKGAITVLKDLGYPDKIIQNTKNILNNL
jgi:hypothetical protein